MYITNTFKKLSRLGVLPRADLKNELFMVNTLIRTGFVKKVHKKGFVFYELTEKSLDPLDDVRLSLLAEARLRSELAPRQRDIYRALLGDIRFLDTSIKEARDFCFLGDWRLARKPVRSQLLLAQFRFYNRMGLQ